MIRSLVLQRRLKETYYEANKKSKSSRRRAWPYIPMSKVGGFTAIFGKENLMNFNIECAPEYAFLNVQIPRNQTIKVEASAMASMDTNIKMKTKFKGGFSRFLAKESLFVNEFTAEGGDGEISIAPGPSGDIGHYYLDNNRSFYLTATSFVASSLSVNQLTKWQGFTRGFFSGESFFLIRNEGEGHIWFNCFGGLIEIDVAGEYIVDTGHIVAFEEGLTYNISRIGGYKSLFFGEGFVCRFAGEGKVWIQTKNPISFVRWANRFRKVQSSN